MPKKIICRFHEEQTPSCVVYDDNFYCFGCGKHGTLSELGDDYENYAPIPTIPENIQESLEYIESLPKEEVRGLLFPVDHRGFYIVWPDKSYYKIRHWQEGSAKYIGARGHTRKPFWARKADNKHLAIVEGELNALSIAKANPDLDVVSLGGVGDFTEKKIKQLLYNYTQYSIIVCIADADAPGATAIINTLSVLWANKLKAVGWPMNPDANEVLTRQGCDELRQQTQERLKRAMD